MGSIYFGETYSLVKFIKKVFRRLNLDVEKYLKIDKNLYRPIDIQINYGDNSKAKNKLKWNYDMTFEQLIDKLVEAEIEYLKWELNNKKIFSIKRNSI